MFFKLFIIFAIMPIVEIALLLEVGDMIGGWTTLAIVILTAFIGAKLVREQGIATLRKVQQQSAQGQLPAQSLVEGLMLLIAGVLLVTPGFVTDAIGFLLVLPVTRVPLAIAASKHFQANIMRQSSMGAGFQFHSHASHSANHENPFEQSPRQSSDRFGQGRSVNHDANQGTTIEGEYQRKE